MSRPQVRLRWYAGAPRVGWVDVLSDDERARHAAMTHRGSADAFLAGRWLVRSLLSGFEPAVRPSDWRFVDSDNGKPECDPASAHPAIRFNLAHTDGMVVAGASPDAELGVDVEDTGRSARVDALIERYFAPEERAWLEGLEPEARRSRFFDTWVLKEAAIKMRGGALGESIGKVVVVPGDGPVGLRPSNSDEVTFRRWQVDRHVIALAVDAPGADVVAGPLRPV